jgi:hypothetical protein
MRRLKESAEYFGITITNNKIATGLENLAKSHHPPAIDGPHLICFVNH